MNKGIIYLVQPAELVGTTRYKIGCSSKNTLERCNKGYKKGTRYLCIMECVNPFKLENHIKIIFNIHFKLIAGTEYFDGNEKKIRTKFIEIINKEINNDEINNDEINNDEINNDKIKNEIDIFINEKFEITLCPKDIIPKKIILTMLSEKSNYNYNNNNKQIISDMKKLNIEYNKAKKTKGYRGCFVGIKYKEI